MELEYPVHIIPAEHAHLPDPMDDVSRQIKAGNMRAHLWNPPTIERVRFHRPWVIGVDSNYASFNPDLETVDWGWLPGSPRQLNGRDFIYLVSGDLLHQELVNFDTKDKMYTDLEELGWGEVTGYLYQ